MWASLPNSTPGTTAIRAASRRKAENSVELVMDLVLESLAVGSRDVGEDVEGTLGALAGDPGHGVQPVYDGAATLGELLAHPVGGLLIPDQGRHRGALRDGGRVRGHLALQAIHGLDDLRRARGIPHAPARHGVGLGERVGDDGPRVHLVSQRRDADVLVVVIDQRLVGLVREEAEVPLHGQGGEALQLLPREGGTGGVGRGVEEQDLRPGRDQGLHQAAVDAEALLLPRMGEDRDRPAELHLLREAHPVRGRDDHLVARVQERLEDVVEGMLAPAGDEDLVPGIAQAVVPLHLGHHGVLQLIDAASRGVLGEALPDGLDRGLLDVGRRVEVWLARAEADDVDAFGAHAAGGGADGQSG